MLLFQKMQKLQNLCYSIKYIPREKYTNELCKLALSKRRYFTEEICLFAVQRDRRALKNIPYDCQCRNNTKL